MVELIWQGLPGGGVDLGRGYQVVELIWAGVTRWWR